MQDRRLAPGVAAALAVGIALGNALIGLPYMLHAFGPTEAEVVQWGRVALAAGLVLAGLSFALTLTEGRAAALRLVVALGYGFLALMQVLPSALWPLFHGTGVSDGSPPSAFVAHWAYALPHVALLAGNVVVMWRLLRPSVRVSGHR